MHVYPSDSSFLTLLIYFWPSSPLIAEDRHRPYKRYPSNSGLFHNALRRRDEATLIVSGEARLRKGKDVPKCKLGTRELILRLCLG
jgi:hypothetical protein